MASDTPPESNRPGTEVVLRGKRVRQDVYGHVSLDDIWAIAKASITRTPTHWRRQRGVEPLIAALQKKVTASYLEAKMPIVPVIYATRGRLGATFAHPVLAAAYAGYLSPKLEIEIREVWLRYRAADAALADEILQRASAEENQWAAMRALARAKRVNYTTVLRDHGVIGKGYPQCTDAVYRQILGGSAWQIRINRSLPPKTNLRDNIGTDELSYVMAAESLAADRIEEEGRRGNDDCAYASARSASFIRDAIERDKQDRQKRLLD